ncbi:MAG TPA: CopG family ribbon-helix-helix protein [Terriglobales bacterium]|jgi:predicted transcriptional regulator
MKSTTSATLSIRLRAETKRRLARLAKTSGRSANFLVADAVESYLDSQERLRAELRDAERDVQAGHYIPHEAMKAWLLSWGTEHELPPPRCVCGESHGGPTPWR